jgi:hypothetical protein
VGRRYFAALYRPGCISELPWGSDPFDCVVFLSDLDEAQRFAGTLSSELARSRVDWVQVAGRGAEELHDAIDRASVAAGRQRAVGYGSPMTSWHEEAESLGEMAEVARLCFGGQDQVLVLVVGRDADLSASVEALQGRTRRCTCRGGLSALQGP